MLIPMMLRSKEEKKQPTLSDKTMPPPPRPSTSLLALSIKLTLGVKQLQTQTVPL